MLDLRKSLDSTAFAFRGYNTTNLGRSAELLAHPRYGPIFERYLREASGICIRAGTRCDLVERVAQERESSIETFGEDIGLIIATSLAQLECLRTFFGVDYAACRMGFGYSLGEITALVASGVFQCEDALHPLVTMADECAQLAEGVTMGIVFSRGPALDVDAVQRLCLKITAAGRGTIAVSSFLSPNTVLVLGQGDTVDRFREALSTHFAFPPHLRKHHGPWPPLHTPIMWQRNIPNRAAVMLQTTAGGFQAPVPPVLSLVTGKASYNDYNSRDLVHRWLDHPQRLWDAVCEVLGAGIDIVVHVGPAPNLVPATFKRLSDNITSQLSRRTLNSLGLRAMSGVANRPWLAKVLSTRMSLLRAPYVLHVILEDWLLEQGVPQEAPADAAAP